jgi:hypothetical protein
MRHTSRFGSDLRRLTMPSFDPLIRDTLAREVPLRIELEPAWNEVLARAKRGQHLSRRRRQLRVPQRWRPLVIPAVAVAALVSAGVGIAAGVGAFEGTAAPPDVTTSFTQLNKMADLAVQQGIAAKWPHADVSRAHGVIEIQTPDGPEDLWAAPNDQGGACYFIDWANDPPSQDGSKYGFRGGCNPPPPVPASSSPPAPSNISFGDVWVVGHPDLWTLWGTVSVPAATVEVTFEGGSKVTLPVVEHAFLGSLSQEVKPSQVTAFDAAGNQVAQQTLAP